MLSGGRIPWHRRLLELGYKSCGGDQLDHALERCGEQHVKRLDMRVEAEASELGENPFGIVLVVRRADVVGTRGEPAHVGPQRIGRGNGAELRLPVPFGLGGFRCEATQLVSRRGGRRGCEEQAGAE